MSTTTPWRETDNCESNAQNFATFLHVRTQPGLTLRASPAIVPNEPQGEKARRWHDAAAPRGGLEHVIPDIVQALSREHPSAFMDLTCRLTFVDDGLEIAGEVPSIAVKRRALRVAAAHPDVGRVVDRLRVTPSCRMSDTAIAEQVADALQEEATLRECTIRKRVEGRLDLVQQPACVRGEVCVAVENRVVTLVGQLPTHAHKRLAGVLAWWVPGTRDVVDRLDVLSAERDDDEAISLAVRTALEKDPLVDASQVRVKCHAHMVTLTGLVWGRAERQAAENDAWSVFGVAEVNNQLFVAEEV